MEHPRPLVDPGASARPGSVLPRVRSSAGALGLLALVGCGHISNQPIQADADFLGALPDRTRQALVAPEDASASAGATLALPAPTFGPDHTWSTADRERTGAVPTFLPPGFSAVDADDLPGIGLGGLPADPTGELPQWTSPDHSVHGGYTLADTSLPRLSPVAQAQEAFDILGSSFAQVFEAADLVRADAPTATSEDAREWAGLSWHGGALDVTMSAVGEAEYAWAMSGDDGAVFLDGEHAGYPTIRTGSGEFRFDQATWAAAYGFEAAGVVTVAYDNRAGVDLDLHLDGVAYADADDGCGDAAPPVVDLGPSQRYLRENDTGDYQFLTTRAHGCTESAETSVRVRWTAEGGRADARIRVGPLQRWTWSQCWSGRFDADTLDYEHLVVTGGADADGERIATGDVARCVYADFAEVDAAVVSGQ